MSGLHRTLAAAIATVMLVAGFDVLVQLTQPKEQQAVVAEQTPLPKPAPRITHRAVVRPAPKAPVHQAAQPRRPAGPPIWWIGPRPAGPSFTIRPANAWAVIVGVQHYWAPTEPTEGALGDADNFRTLLLDAGWSPSHILVLEDNQATANGIRSAEQWLVAHSTANSFTLFHYSGHVHGGFSAYHALWGVDNQFIPASEFGATMSQLRGWAWVDVAGCEARDFDRGISSPQRLFTSSSQVYEKSYEVPNWGRRGESVWSGLDVDYGLIQRQAAGTSYGAVSIQQAALWAAARAPSVTVGQYPYGPQHPWVAGGYGNWYLISPNG